MYAIRSYYARKDVHPVVLAPAPFVLYIFGSPSSHHMLTLQQGGSYEIQTAPPRVRSFSLHHSPVITSYSIHYTKLYDLLGARRQAEGLEALGQIAGGQGLAGRARGASFEQVGRQIGHVHLERAKCRVLFRITSYNVCYTKLLRC